MQVGRWKSNVVAIYDIAGAVQAKYSYDAFGNCTVTDSTNSHLANYNPIRYRGYYYDRETKLYHAGARYYSSEFRRFIQPADVSSLNPHSINGLNLYAYANNNPIAISYKTNVGANSVVTYSNPQFNVMVPIINQISRNSTSFSLKP